MRNLMNSDQSYTGLVQKYIGSAYDNVRRVSESLEEIKIINEAILSGDLNFLEDFDGRLDELIAAIKEFENTYYGALSEVPLTRPDGTPTQEGDMYYSLHAGSMMIYQGTSWNSLGALANTLKVFEVTHADIGLDGVILDLATAYNAGGNQLLVFVNATFQYPLTAETPNGAYVESSDTEITFPPTTLIPGDVVTVLKGEILTTVDHITTVNIETYRVAMTGETLVTLPGSMQYVPATNNLDVYANGLLQIVNIDYVESTPTAVTFIKPLHAGDLLQFRVGHIITDNIPVPSEGTLIATLNVAAEFKQRGHTLREDGLVILLGYNGVNDGGGGLFNYDTTMNRIDANGGTIIDATTNIDNQGAGTGNGCWVRMYTDEIKAEWWGYSNPKIACFNKIGKGQHGDSISIYGFHQDGDQGAGEFYWSDDIPRRDHDGGVIIDPAKPFPADWTNPQQAKDWYNPINNTGWGCWVRGDRSTVNIEGFGAIPTQFPIDASSVDNSPVLYGIGKAINAHYIGQIKIPARIYFFNSAQHLSITNLVGMFRLYGEGDASKLILGPNSSTGLIEIIEGTGITVERVEITDQKGIAGSSAAIILANCSEVIIKENVFNGFAGSAVKIRENIVTATGTACNNIKICDNHFNTCGLGGDPVIALVPKAFSENIVVCNNSFKMCGAYDRSVILGGMACTGAIINDNMFFDITGSAIQIEAFEDILCEGNLIYGVTQYGIRVDVSVSPDYADASLNHCKIFNNNIFHNNSTFVAMYGIFIEGNVNNPRAGNGPISVHENSISGCGGVLCSPQVDLRNVSIKDNQFIDIPDVYYGILFDQANGGNAVAPSVQYNVLRSDWRTRIKPLAIFEYVPEVIFGDNRLKLGGQFDVEFNNCSRSQIRDNVFFESNPADYADHAAVHIIEAGTATYTIKGNKIIAGVYGLPVSLVATSSASPQIVASGNDLGDFAVALTKSGAITLVSDGTDPILQMGTTRHFYALAPPATLVGYHIGDTVWNMNPAAGGTLGWIAVIFGGNLTWKTFGTIAA